MDADFLRGRRVSKDAGGVISTFVYDGWNVIEERVSNGASTTTKHNVWGLDLSQSMEGAGGIGGLVAVISGAGEASLFSFDGNGNVSEVLDATSGQADAHYEYDAFGNVIVAVGAQAQANPWRFSTKYVDGESGYSYYGFRYYDAGFGRWVNRDPAGENGAKNLYGFVRNNATQNIDVLGLAEYLWAVTKSFIAPITGGTGFRANTMGQETAVPEHVLEGNGVRRSDGDIDSTTGLLLAGPLFGLDEDPRSDAKDGAYRLYTRLNVLLECCGSECKFQPRDRGPWGTGTGYWIDRDGGHEVGAFSGTISVDSVHFRKTSDSQWTFHYRGFGRPNFFLEGGFQMMALRRARYIWHEVRGTIGCAQDGKPTIDVSLGGSYFPSHRQWVRGDLKNERPQGVLTDLWRSDPSDADLVAGHHLFTPDGPVPAIGLQPSLPGL